MPEVKHQAPQKITTHNMTRSGSTWVLRAGLRYEAACRCLHAPWPARLVQEGQELLHLAAILGVLLWVALTQQFFFLGHLWERTGWNAEEDNTVGTHSSLNVPLPPLCGSCSRMHKCVYEQVWVCIYKQTTQCQDPANRNRPFPSLNTPSSPRCTRAQRQEQGLQKGKEANS